jgi:hypothetical protein
MADWGPSLRQELVLDIQGNDLPKEVKKELMELREHNDHYIHLDVDEELEEELPLTYKFLSSKNIKRCIVLIWW